MIIKKFITILVLMLIFGWTNVNAVDWTGTGTSADPYQITTHAELATMATNVNGGTSYAGVYFKLMNDISLSGYANWDPIGNGSTKYFMGVFDGNNKMITGLTITGTSTYRGLFGYIQGGCEIKNLSVESCNLAGSTYIGGLVGYLQINTASRAITISNCYTSGTISGTDNYVGGMIGFVSYGATGSGGETYNIFIDKCSSSANVSSSLNSAKIGGLIGSIEGNSATKNPRVSNCYSTGSVTTTTASVSAGGLIGYNSYSMITDSYSRGAVSATGATSNAGGLIGYNSNSNVTNCYSYGKVTGTATTVLGFIGSYASGTITSCYWDTETSTKATSAGGTGVTGKTTAQMKTQATYSGWDFTTIWSYMDGYPLLAAQNVFVSGTGTVGDPYQITTREQLKQLAINTTGGTAYTGKYFKLMNDISLSGYTNWTPIGSITTISPTFTGTPFSGNFNGNGFTISGLTISVTATTTQGGFGIFGCVNATGVVSNLTVSGVSITISIAGIKNVAGLVGTNLGTVDGCSSSGTITTVSTGESTGGLVGENNGVASLVKNSNSSVSVTGGSYLGGLVGMNYGTVDSSYASGTINGVGHLGGLVGYNRSLISYGGGKGTVTNSHSTGNVTGSGSNIGGFIGRNNHEYTGLVLGYVENCYSTGTVTASETLNARIGGFIGYNYSYYNRTATDPNPGEVDIKGYIKNCYSSGTVISAGSMAGGFVGHNYSNYNQNLEPVPADLKLFGHLQQCYSTGDVTGNGTQVGGFVGYNQGNYLSKTLPANRTAAGILQDCYSWGNVIRASGETGTSIGGFCGENNYIINRCYSKGSVTYTGGTNPTNKGFLGLITVIVEGKVLNQMYGNFWDIETSAQPTLYAGATGKTTAQMKSITTFEDAGWDFKEETTNGTNNYWWIDGAANNGYPFLLWQPYTPAAPTTQSSAITSSSVMANQVTLNWTKGNGTKRVVFAKAGNSGTTAPTNSATYTANAAFGTGTEIPPSSGWFCVYKGGDTTATVTGLTAETDYIFQVFDYNSFSPGEIYITSVATDNPKSLQTTLPIEVTATEGTPEGEYSTLKDAFDMINMGIHNGFIEVKVKGSTVETASCVLNASGSGSAEYDSVLIYPTAAGLSISGNRNAPLIDLNGADHVTIDGRVNATGSAKDLVITNTSNSNNATTSTIRFINDATANTVKYCTLKGSSTANLGGILQFSTTTGTTGNDGNTIDNNNITNAADANRPLSAVYSAGTNAKENSGNTISNNNIYDFLNRGMASYGIRLGNYSTDWIISGNSFYETASFVPTATVEYRVINIENSSGINFTVTNNYIGGSSAKCGGSAFTKTNGSDNTFNGMYLNVGTSTPSNVQGNSIKNISWSNSGVSSFHGIMVAGGAVDIGTTTGNYIGQATGNSSITLTNGNSGGGFYGFYLSSTGTMNVDNNSIGSITTSNANTENSTSFYGILRISTGTTTISNNSIGSTDDGTVNSINANSGSTRSNQYVFGITNNSAGTVSITGNTISKLTNSATTTGTSNITGVKTSGGTNTISNNVVRDLSIACQNTNSYSNLPIAGILVYITTANAQLISNNTIYNLSNTHTTFTGKVVGIYYEGTATASSISGNFIHSLSVDAATTNASVNGIRFIQGNASLFNNVIFLGGNTSTLIAGIMQESTSDLFSLYYNTIYLSGNPTSGVKNSFCFSSATTTRDIRNNLFINARSNNGATGSHTAISLSSKTNLTIDYNDYFVSGTGGVLGEFNSNYIASLASWRAITLQDAGSISTTPSFLSAGGTTALSYTPQPPVSLPGTTIAEVTTDFAGRTRAATPTIGAFEAVAPISVAASVGTATGSYTTLKGAFDKINDGTHKGDITIKLNANSSATGIIESATAALNASGTGLSLYSSVLVYPTVTGIILTGAIAGPLVNLNGADNVMIDGRVNQSGGKDLNIVNTSETAVASAIKFINTAENNKVKYCTIKGSPQSASNGVILFSSATAGNGNSGNRIDHCDITGYSIKPNVMVFSYGTINFENKNDTISNCNIFNFIKETTTSMAINVTSNSFDWTISGNNFYETMPVVSTFSGAVYNFIRLYGGAGTLSTISDNFMGGTAADHSGTMTISTATHFSLTGTITNCNVSMRNNTIGAISITGENGTQFTGINIVSNVGTISGNTIGSEAYPITLASVTQYSVNSYGIYCQSSATANIQNNTIGSISVLGSEATGHTFYAISRTGGRRKTTISNNIIGGTGPSGTINASSRGGNAAQSIYGIYYTAATDTTTIAGNTITNLINSGTHPDAKVVGLHYYGSTTPGLVSGNFIHGFNATLINPGIYGINIAKGAATYANNIVALGSEITTGNPIYGFNVASDTVNTSLYFNTVNIEGSETGLTGNSYALSDTTTSVRNYRNNIFSNSRSGGTTGKHYAVALKSATDLTMDYNDYYAPGTTGNFSGNFNNTDVTSLADWKTATGRDTNSLCIAPLFTNSPGTAAADYQPEETSLVGGSGTGITTDFSDTATRSLTYPAMGAWEYPVYPSPAITTKAITGITLAEATSGGESIDEKGNTITAKGIVWDIATAPTTALTTKTSETVDQGSEDSDFSSSITGLTVNKKYYVRAYATNIVATGYGDEKTFYTLALVPGKPVVDNPQPTSVNVAINANSNPAITTYAILDTITGKFVQINGALGSTAAWQTEALWEVNAGNTAQTVTGLTGNSKYVFKVRAKNGDNVETDYSSKDSLVTLAQVPAAPTVNAATDSSANVAINANGNPEATEFAIQETGGSKYVQADGTLGDNSVWQTETVWETDAANTAKTVTGLNFNTQYTFQVKARNSNNVETVFSATNSLYTLANMPEAPTVNNPTMTTLDVAINANGNPVSTEFAIHEVTLDKFIQLDGKPGASAVWQTAALWGTKTVTELDTATTYTFEVKARNAALTETAYGDTISGTTQKCYMGEAWTVRTAPVANASWMSVTYGNGKFVAVGEGSKVMTSPDGITWTAFSAPEANNWWSVTYGNNMFVAVASNGTNRVMTSPDGETWTARAAAEANSWQSVTYGNGKYVAVATDGTNRVMTSTNGTTWTARAAAEDNRWQSVIYANNKFVAVSSGGTNRVMTSIDGITWTSQTTTGSNSWQSVTYSNGKYVAVAQNGTNQAMTSTDGITWTNQTTPVGPWYAVTYGNGMFVAIGAYSAAPHPKKVMTSIDGITWTASSSADDGSWWRSVVYANDVFVAVANYNTKLIMTSDCSPVLTVTTQDASAIATTSATGNGTILLAGLTAPTDRGVVLYPYTDTDKIIGGSNVINVHEAGTFGTGTFTASLASLTVNTRYNFRAHATDASNGTTYGARVDFWTLANVPTAPTVSNPTASTLNVAINVNANPATTQFAIFDTITDQFVQANGSLGASAVWQTTATWGTKTVTGLTAGTEYTFKVKARNGGNVETAFGATASGIPLLLPLVTTEVASDITTSSATGNGDITDIGIDNPTNRGLIYYPFTDTDKIIGGTDVTNVSETGTYDTAAYFVTLTGLSVNTRYNARAHATNTDGTGYGARVDFWTLANEPSAPTVNTPTTTTLNVAINANGNPAITEYAIYDTIAGKFVQTNGTLGASAAWQTEALWEVNAGNTAKTITGLAVNSLHTFKVISKNGAGTETEYSGLTSLYTLAAIPGLPTVNAADSIALNVAISANGNPDTTGFAIYERKGNKYVQANGTLGNLAVWQTQVLWETDAINTAKKVTGLSPDQEYTFQVKARNGDDVETIFSEADSLYTLANVPSPPVVINPTATSLDVVVLPNGNPATTVFAIQDSVNNLYVKADGTRQATAVWQTAALWDTITVTGLSTGVTYYFRVKAKNGNDVETAFGLSTGQNTCSNPTVPGSIGTNQTICYGTKPSALNSVTLPSNYGGTLEYKWQYSTPTDSTSFMDIAHDSIGYAPGNLTNTTWYKRVVRVDCKTDWVGAAESNVVKITVDPLPEASAGGSTTICVSSEATVSGASSANGDIEWTSNGSGSITDETSLSPNYTPAAGDAGNTVTLTMTVTSNNTCGIATATATYTVHVDPLPEASAGGSTTICVSSEAIVSGASSANGDIEWTSNGSGSITYETSLSPTYTPAAGDAGNTVTLTMTVTSNNTCGTATATATYTVYVDPLTVGGSISGNDSTIVHTSTGDLSLTGHTGDVLQWEKKLDAGDWEIIPGTAEATYSDTPITVGAWSYRALVQSGVCSSTYSAGYAVVVIPDIPDHFTLTSPGTAITGSASGNFVVSLFDQYDNPTYCRANTSFNLSTSSNGSSRIFTPGSPLQLANGTYTNTFTYTDSKAGTHNITATYVSGSSGLTGETLTVPITITLPVPWVQINLGASNGTTEFFPEVNGGTYKLTAQGLSAPKSDVMNFVYQSLCGNGTVIARLSDVANGGWAGVMMRESNASGAKTVLFKTKLYNPMANVGVRSATNGNMSNTMQNLPSIRWMKIQRTNASTFVIYTSYNGTSWTRRYTATVTMNNCINAGFFTENAVSGRTTTAWIDHAEVVGYLKETEEENIDMNTQDMFEVMVYPNPANDLITISIPENAATVKVTLINASGLVVETSEFNTMDAEYPISHIKPGLYLLRFERNGMIVCKRLVVL